MIERNNSGTASLSSSMSADASSSSSDIEFQDSSLIQTNSMASPSTFNMGFSARALSAAGAAFFSAILVNPLDVAKTRLQAQAAGVPFQNLSHSCSFGTNTMTRMFGLGEEFGKARGHERSYWTSQPPIQRSGKFPSLLKCLKYS